MFYMLLFIFVYSFLYTFGSVKIIKQKFNTFFFFGFTIIIYIKYYDEDYYFQFAFFYFIIDEQP